MNVQVKRYEILRLYNPLWSDNQIIFHMIRLLKKHVLFYSNKKGIAMENRKKYKKKIKIFLIIPNPIPQS